MTRLVVVFGPSGAGKSTHCRASYPAGVTISADDYRPDPRVAERGRRCYLEAAARISRGDPLVVIDTAATVDGYLTRWGELRHLGATVEWVAVTVADPVTLRRNVHHTPPDKLTWMWESMEDTIAEWYRGDLRVIRAG